MVVETYTNGVSTRKIKHLAESLGIENISAAEVSQMNKRLDEMVKEFHEQKLEEVWLCVSDAHIGLQAAIKKCWTGSV